MPADPTLAGVVGSDHRKSRLRRDKLGGDSKGLGVFMRRNLTGGVIFGGLGDIWASVLCCVWLFITGGGFCRAGGTYCGGGTLCG